jgi:hypothetical protein
LRHGFPAFFSLSRDYAATLVTAVHK